MRLLRARNGGLREYRDNLIYLVTLKLTGVLKIVGGNRYRYQLEAFVDKVKGRTPQIWISEADSLANMKAIESVYENVSHRQILTPLFKADAT